MATSPLPFRYRCGVERGTVFWWEHDSKEKYWVEIRHIEGLGTYLGSPLEKANGSRDLWYDLVGMVSVGDVILHWNVREGRRLARAASRRSQRNSYLSANGGSTWRGFSHSRSPSIGPDS